MRTKRIALCALLTAIALTIFVLEAQIPPLVPLPGVKLGLSNIVTLFALCALGPKESGAILLVRIVLGNLVTGQVSAILYSLAGGVVSLLAMLFALRFIKPSQIWVAGVLGGIFHNIGQCTVAVLLTQTPGLFVYLPILLLCGIFTGALTGLCAQIINNRRIFQ